MINRPLDLGSAAARRTGAGDADVPLSAITLGSRMFVEL